VEHSFAVAKTLIATERTAATIRKQKGSFLPNAPVVLYLGHIVGLFGFQILREIHGERVHAIFRPTALQQKSEAFYRFAERKT
jgi:hypothetical protein